MLNLKNRILILLSVIIIILLINAASFFILYYYFKVAKDTVYIFIAAAAIASLLMYSIIINTVAFSKRKSFSFFFEELLNLEIPEITKAVENNERDGVEFSLSKLIRATAKLNDSLQKINQQAEDTSTRILNFSDELEMLKINADSGIKASLVNTESLKKISDDFNDFIYIKEHFIKSIKIEFFKSIEIIDRKFKQKETLSDFINKLALAMTDIESALDSMEVFCVDFQKNQSMILSAISEMLANIEKQSINILNFYIFSHPEKNEQNDILGSESIAFEREENINNIKSINEIIKNEVYKIKNVLTILFESNKNFSAGLEGNKKTFSELTGYIQEIPVMLTQFSEMDLSIKSNLQKFLNTSSKFNEKLKNESEHLKNMNIKLNNINKCLEDLKIETANLTLEGII